MVKKVIKFRKGSSATIDDLEILFRYLPLSSRIRKNYSKGYMSVDSDTESYFEKGCKVTIEFEGEL